MSEQSEEPIKQAAEESTELNKAFKVQIDKIEDEAITNYTTEFDRMVHSGEWEIEGEKIKYHWLKRKEVGQFKALQAMIIDQKKNWDDYTDNVFKKACLLMEDMTIEKLDELPWTPVENLVTAWSVRFAEGFH